MRNTKRLLALALSGMLIFTGCGKNSSTEDNDSNKLTSTEDDTSSGKTSAVVDEADMFTERDMKTDYDESDCIKITLNGSSASCDSNSVKISGTTITIKEEATYLISGTLDDGMVIVDTDDTAKLQIVLDNASITNNTSAALYILKADKVFVTLADGSTNTLANGGTFTAIDDNNIDGAVFSKQDLTFNGSGSLTVTSPAAHGIVCKDDLVFTGGIYTVNSASHGLDANDSVRITQASITVASGKDGIHAENTDDTTLGFIYMKDGSLDISAEGDGLSAESTLQINDGTIAVVSGGGSENSTKSSSDSWGDFMGGHGGGMGVRHGYGSSSSSSSSSSDSSDSTSLKAIKASGEIAINGGTFTINSADDSIHGNTSVTINSGTFEIASGDDAVHAEETLTINGGKMNISECYEGFEALNIYVKGGDFVITASDDGLNAAGGTDSSGSTGGRDGMFGGGMGGHGSSSSGGHIEVSGGNLTLYSGGDAMDSNGDLLISGGYTYATNPSSGDVSVLDAETSAEITGGTFIGLGISSMMAMSFTSAKQGVIACTCGSQPAGSELKITGSKGNEIVSMTTEYSTYLIIISTPELVSGESYNLSIGSTSGTVEAN